MRTQSTSSEKRVTLKEVADAAGVSLMVASRAVRGNTKGVRRDAAKRAQNIRRIAAEMGYRRDLAAAATRARRFGSVALVLSSSDGRRSNLPSGLLAGLTETLDEADMHLSIARLPDHALTSPEKVPRLLRDMGADGLLINYNQWVPPEMNRLIEQHGLPAVWLNEKRPVNAVYPDDYAAAREATLKLIALGHRRVVYVGRPPADDAHYSETDRHNGYADGMKEAGLTPVCLESASSLPDASIRDALHATPHPTAAITYNTVRATTLLIYASELNLHCPTDLSIVTFSGSAVQVVHKIATMRIPDRQVGHDGVNMLIRRIEKPDDIPSRCVPFEWIEGDTIATCNQQEGTP